MERIWKNISKLKTLGVCFRNLHVFFQWGGASHNNWTKLACEKLSLVVSNSFRNPIDQFEPNDRSRFVSQIICISEISNWSEKSSNGRKIARMAPILTIFEPIESQRHDRFRKSLRRRCHRRRCRSFSERYKSDAVVNLIVGLQGPGSHRPLVEPSLVISPTLHRFRFVPFCLQRIKNENDKQM